MKRLTLFALLAVACCALALIPLAAADAITADVPFYTDEFNGTLTWQDIAMNCTIDFNVTSGNLTSSGLLTADGSGGLLVLVTGSNGYLNVSSSITNCTFYLGGQLLTSTIHFVNGGTYRISWIYPITYADRPDVLNIRPFWQYLFNGDFLGFFQAIFLNAFLTQNVLFGSIIMLLLVPLYIRTKSLLLVCILWILLGSSFIVAIPALSGLAVIFLILGVGGLIWRLVKPS